MKLPTRRYLQARFTYVPTTGELIWKPRPRRHFNSLNAYSVWNSKYADTVAGYFSTNGYVAVTIDGKNYLAHRVIWKLLTGDEPELIDHKNTDGYDNRQRNLRVATQVQNSQNRRMSRNNTSGVKGVYWDKKAGKWASSVFVNRRKHFIGLFDSIYEAERETNEARKRLHREFARAA